MLQSRTPRTLAYAIALILATSLARADITLTGLTESVHTKIAVQPSASVVTDEDSLSVPTPPPTSISVNSVTAFGASAGAGTASITVNAYSGPTAIGLSSTSFSIDADTFGLTSGNSLVSNPVPFANAILEMSFTLNDFHPYSYAKSGPFFPGGNAFSKSGVGNVSEGTGILSPGDYAFNVSSLGSGGGTHTIELAIGTAVPEPTLAALLVPAAFAMTTRKVRRRTHLGTA